MAMVVATVAVVAMFMHVVGFSILTKTLTGDCAISCPREHP
jgi:hypothetical protein